jgi:hypothetical protein
LGELLRRHYTEREAGVDNVGGQPIGRTDTALDHLAEADLLRMPNSLLHSVERSPLEENWRVCRVAGSPKLVREDNDARGQTLRVMEQDNFGHTYTPSSAGCRLIDRSQHERPVLDCPGFRGVITIRMRRTDKARPLSL